MTAEFLWINISLAMLFLALRVGVPTWMVFKHPDRHPRETRTVPAYLRQRTAAGLPPPRRVPARDRAERRELVPAGRS